MSVKVQKDKYGEYYVEAQVTISFKAYLRDKDGYCIGSKDSKIPLPDPLPNALTEKQAKSLVESELANYNSSDLWEQVVNFGKISLHEQP